MRAAEQAAVPTTLSSNETVAMRLAAVLRRNGVELVFGQSNPVLLHLALPAVGIRNIVYRTEHSGGAMADGYARISRRVAVVTAQNGPAATLLVAPLAEALRSSIPLVALVQDVPAAARDRNAFQDLDHLQLFAGCAKWVRRVDDSDRIEHYLDMALRAAASGRGGPAVLLIPADIFKKTAAAADRRQNCSQFPLDPVCPPVDRIAQAADLLATAERPVVIAGGGIHLSGAADALARLQESCHLPVATTQMGKGGVSEEHALSIGVIGYLMAEGNRSFGAAPLIKDADVVLLVGTRTAQNGTDGWTQYPKDARFIHIDIDPLEIGRNYESLRLAGDARLSLEALCEAMRQRDLGKREAARPAVEQAIRRSVAAVAARTIKVRASDQSPIRPERVMTELDRLLTPSSIVVADASHSSIWVSIYLTARKAGSRFLQPRGLAGLGWGVPMAIGAKLAAPASSVFCVVGDGAFAHSWAELETIKRHRLKLTVIVLNNQILASQQQFELVTFGTHTDTGFCPVDHAAIARACGLTGVRIERPDQIGPALQAALVADEATVLDILVDPEARPPMVQFRDLPSQFD